MNKVIVGLIAAVCVLGMALVMLNDRLGRKTGPTTAKPAVAEQSVDVPPAFSSSQQYGGEEQETHEPPDSPARQRQAAIELEREEAIAALAPPKTAMQEPEKVIPETAPAAIEPAPQAPPPPPVAAPKPAPKPEPKAETPRPEPKAEAPKPAPKAPQAQTPSAKSRSINKFVVYSREKGATVRIGGAGKINYQHMTLENPNRVVLDLDGEWVFPEIPGIPKNDLVNKIRIGKNGDKTRMVIDLKEKPRISRVIPSRNGDSLDVRVDK